MVPLLTWEFEDPLVLLPWVSRNLLSHITESLVPTEWMADFHIILLEPSHFAPAPLRLSLCVMTLKWLSCAILPFFHSLTVLWKCETPPF